MILGTALVAWCPVVVIQRIDFDAEYDEETVARMLLLVQKFAPQEV